ALEQASEHPVAQALKLAAADLPLPATERLDSTPGKGVEGVIAGQSWRLGSAEFINEWLATPLVLAQDWHADCTLVVLANRQAAQAVFAIGDTVRDDAAAMVQALRQRGIAIHLLSGDGAGAVHSLADSLGISDWHARATPEDKLAFCRPVAAGRQAGADGGRWHQ
ncbi:HAD family hydrolase, partial [Aquitalea magnusonii]|uniref:HAD family hydrolase n=1 Tax=Aquitalea magnusonii TaxID=332411 RepID=UPI001EFB8709